MYLWAALVSAGPMLLAYVPGLSFLDWSTSLIGAFGLRFYFAGRRARHRPHPRDGGGRGRGARADRAGGRGVVVGRRAGLGVLLFRVRAVAEGDRAGRADAAMSQGAWIAWATASASAALLALFLARGRMAGRLYLDALAIGLTLGAVTAAALAPFDLKTNPLHFSPSTLAFLFAGLPEEGIKLAGVGGLPAPALSRARPRPDVVFAAGALSLGFAALENVFYLANAGAAWATLAFERALTAVPFHVFEGLAGGFVVAAVQPDARGVGLALLAWLALAGVHGAYDFAVFAGVDGAAPGPWRGWVATAGWDASEALRALLAGAEAAAALAGVAAVAALPAAGGARPERDRLQGLRLRRRGPAGRRGGAGAGRRRGRGGDAGDGGCVLARGDPRDFAAGARPRLRLRPGPAAFADRRARRPRPRPRGGACACRRGGRLGAGAMAHARRAALSDARRPAARAAGSASAPSKPMAAPWRSRPAVSRCWRAAPPPRPRSTASTPRSPISTRRSASRRRRSRSMSSAPASTAAATRPPPPPPTSTRR